MKKRDAFFGIVTLRNFLDILPIFPGNFEASQFQEKRHGGLFDSSLVLFLKVFLKVDFAKI